MSKHGGFLLSYFQIVCEWRDFTVVTELRDVFKSLYGLEGRGQEIRDICMDFEPCLKVRSLISVQHKSIKLGQMIHLNVIFHVVGSNYRLVKILNSPQFLAQSQNGQYKELINICILKIPQPSCYNRPRSAVRK